MPSLLARLHTVALQPAVTAPLLLALLYWRRPENLTKVPIALHSLLTSSQTFRALSILLGLGGTGTISAFLSERSLNNWNTADHWDWHNEIAVVTGGVGGLGEEIVKQLAAMGIKVMVLDVHPPKSELPKSAFFYRTDISSSAEIHEAGEAIRKDHGKPSILVNNAGIASGLTILEEPEERIRKTFDVNAIALWLTAKEFIPFMVERNHGHVVTVASMAAYVVAPQIVDYSASKAGALSFHEGLGNELRSRYKADKVRTTVVTPSFIRTPLTKKALDHPDFKETMMEPEYVASLILKQIISRRSGHLVLPKSGMSATGMRGWPSWMQMVVWKALSRPLSGMEHGAV